jgi:proline iminopeptidase
MRRIVCMLGALSCLLSAAPVAAQLAFGEPEWYLRTPDGCRLFVQEFGRGKDTIIALHGGFGADHSYIIPAFKGLEDRYHIVFYDQRGSIRSPCAINLISVQKHVEDLDRLRASLKLDRVTLVGHSAGTLLAVSYLAEHPDRVNGVVLLGAVVPHTPTSDDERALIQKGRQEARQFRQRPEVAAEIHKYALDRDSTQLTDKELTALWRLQFANSNVYHLERWPQMKGGGVFYNFHVDSASAMPKVYDLTPAIAAHRCPVWVINGDHDYVDWGSWRHKQWTANVPNAHLAIVANAGHVLWIDAPDQFRKLLLQALGSTAQCR